VKPADIEAKRQANAMQEAFRNAKVLSPKQPAKAPTPGKTTKPPRARATTPESALLELVTRIKLKASNGLLDLSKPASELAGALGAADVKQLTLAMTRLGFVRVHRGVSGVVHYQAKR
jgi:hypothetical protein